MSGGPSPTRPPVDAFARFDTGTVGQPSTVLGAARARPESPIGSEDWEPPLLPLGWALTGCERGLQLAVEPGRL
jgi:hypothetical protein